MKFKVMIHLFLLIALTVFELTLSSCGKNNIIKKEPDKYVSTSKSTLLENIINKELENNDASQLIKWIKIYYRSSGKKTKKTIYSSIKKHLSHDNIHAVFMGLKRKSEISKRLVAKFLKNIRTEKILEESAWLLNVPDRFVSSYSVYFLKYIPIDELLPVFHKVLEEDNSDSMKIKIIQLLGQKKSWKSIDLLFELTDDENLSLKSYGLWAFKQISSVKTRAYLTLKLQSEYRKDLLKAAFLIGELKHKEAIMPLIHQMDRLDKLTRRKLSKSLIKL
ncbi:MAG: hypothetical protein OEZ36_09835, partial [Spirochaetota bacterium]|nr:hypothetical protein [Spirochaetota bacterium]